MVMLSRRAKIFCAGQLPGQAGRFVDKDRQALRTDVYFIALVFDGQQRLILFGSAAVQTKVILH